MHRKEILSILVHELWLQNLSHFGTLANDVYIKDAEYLLNNLLRQNVILLEGCDDMNCNDQACNDKFLKSFVKEYGDKK